MLARAGDGLPCIKQFETRHWAMPTRLIGQTIAIHAAKRDTPDEREFWLDVVMNPERRELYGRAFASLGIQNYNDLPRGAIIGTVQFAASQGTDDMVVSEIEEDWGNYWPNRFAWPASLATPFEKPIPCLGRQGFFHWNQ
jgi:hypothetical protein